MIIKFNRQEETKNLSALGFGFYSGHIILSIWIDKVKQFSHIREKKKRKKKEEDSCFSVIKILRAAPKYACCQKVIKIVVFLGKANTNTEAEDKTFYSMIPLHKYTHDTQFQV